MKYLIRKLFALTLVLSMLLSMIPLGTSAESLDEFEDYETLEEIPFEFELEPGDLPFEHTRNCNVLLFFRQNNYRGSAKSVVV